ncbi:MAG: hypothetical protein M1817_006388 [Caeruleum heppii]|nr:MAG: hypothetical protein M1817_006388 [Caeruleum heppii]
MAIGMSNSGRRSRKEDIHLTHPSRANGTSKSSDPLSLPPLQDLQTPFSDPPHNTDLERGPNAALQAPGSRAGLPQTSSTTENNHNTLPPATAPDTEYTWGPSHPCFPHPNPHVPLSSPLYTSTRIIRIKRDWLLTGDLSPQFSNLYPEILDPLLPEADFRQIITKVNGDLEAAFDPKGWRNRVDAMLGLVSLWVWDDLGLTGVKARLRGVEEWIEKWNREVGEKEGVRILPLRRTGYMTLDIQIPDPHIRVDVSEPNSRPQTQHASDAHPKAAGGPNPLNGPAATAVGGGTSIHSNPHSHTRSLNATPR